MAQSFLPEAATFAFVMVAILFAIVLWDAFWLTRQRLDVPTLGEFDNGNFAWSSDSSHEMIRQWGNLGSVAVMIALPWALVGVSNTPEIYAIVWDILLSLHIISLLVPKRYAITQTHLFADGQRYEWSRLKLANKQPRRRIMLLRKNWGVFGPLPLGGEPKDLATALEKINKILSPDEEE